MIVVSSSFFKLEMLMKIFLLGFLTADFAIKQIRGNKLSLRLIYESWFGFNIVLKNEKFLGNGPPPSLNRKRSKLRMGLIFTQSWGLQLSIT